MIQSISDAANTPGQNHRLQELWAWFVAIFTEPFRVDPTVARTLTVAQQEERRRSALLRVIIATLTLLCLVSLPMIPLTHGPPSIFFGTLGIAVLGCGCWLLDQRGLKVLAGVLFLGGFYLALVADTLSQSGGGLDVPSLIALVFFGVVILLAALLLPLWAMWTLAGVCMATTVVALNLMPLMPQLSGTAHYTRVGATVILVTVESLITAIGWMVSKSTTAGLEGAQAAYAREQELSTLKEQFIVSANHELRTPFMAMYGNLELLTKLGTRATPELSTRLVQRSLHAGEIIFTLLDAILDASLVEPDQFALALQPLTLAPLVQDVLAQFDPRVIGEAGAARDVREMRATTVQIAPTLAVMADERRLRQVLTNLVSNALKYSSPETPLVISALAPSTKKGTPPAVRIQVRDYGLGIPPKDAGHLFQRFARLPRDIAGAARGTGVGLYLSRVFVEAMGGQIWVESAGIAGEGSTFIFTLPVAQSVQERVTRPRRQPPAATLTHPSNRTDTPVCPIAQQTGAATARQRDKSRAELPAVRRAPRLWAH